MAGANATLLAEALAAAEAGLCVAPPRQDGSKRPAGDTWERYQRERPSLATLEDWYGDPIFTQYSGMGLVCGAISGNLELFEFDDADTYAAFKATAAAVGLGPLVEHIEGGYLERSPGGGVHWFYRCPTIAGNTKLACRPKQPAEMQHAKDKVRVLIETRGEGGYAVVAPSNGRVHPTGRPYVRLAGSFATILAITPEERAALWQLARSFDQMPRARAPEPGPAPSAGGGERPGDAFNRRATWAEVLESHDWVHVYDRGEATYWRRPGKTVGISATTNYAGSDLLYVFSTSTEFDAQRGYSKFSAYTVLNHGGDFRAAAQALAAAGYGDTARRDGPAGSTDELPPFPLESLPASLRTFVEQGAASLVAPPEYIAVPLLVLAGAVIGNALELELKAGWREGPNLYAAIVGEPGDKKSPALRLASAPVERLQARLAYEYAQEFEHYEAELAAWDAAKKTERGPKPRPPTFPHVFTTDATVEALAPMLLASKGLALVQDELVGWVRGMDAYRNGRGADRQHYLSMWARTTIKVDRKGNSGAPILVPRPVLAVVGGIQPDLLPDLADTAQREDGFVDRLLWSYPLPCPDHWSDAELPAETVAAVVQVFEALYALEAEPADFGMPGPRVVRFDGPAKALWLEWHTALCAERTGEGFPRRLRGPWAKLPSQLARLALILHALDDPQSDQMGADTLARAADLLDYFQAHARRAYQHLVQVRRDLTTRILAALRERGPLTTTELHDVLQRNIPAERLRATLENLEEAGLVQRETQQGEGRGRPATVWRLALAN